MTRGTAPDFTLGAVTWQSWVNPDGSLVWRSTCGRYAVWRDGKVCKAQRGETVSRNEFRDLWSAMSAAQNEARRAAA